MILTSFGLTRVPSGEGGYIPMFQVVTCSYYSMFKALTGGCLRGCNDLAGLTLHLYQVARRGF